MRGRVPLGVLAGLALAVALGAAGVLWATSGGSAGDTARLVPADAALYATVNTDGASRQWAQMSQLLGRLGLDDPLRNARDDGASAADLDWDEDIAPFLGGEASIAMTSGTGERPGLLVILATRDGDKAWDRAARALDRRATGAKARPDVRSYRGVEIRTYGDDGPLPLSAARKDQYLILGTGPEQVQTVLDLAAGRGEALAGQERFKSARAAVAAGPLLFAYTNPGLLAENAGTLASAFAGTFVAPGTSSEAMRTAGLDGAALAFSITAERLGMRFEWQTLGLDANRTAVRMPAAPDISRFAQRAPADSLVFVSGLNLYDGVIRGVADTLQRLADDNASAAPGPAGGASRILDEVKRELGFDIERDLFAHLTGEYAVAAGSGTDGGDGFWAVGMSAVNDAAAVGKALTRFGAYEQRQGRRLTTTPVGGVSVTESRAATGSGDDEYAYTLTGDELIAGYGRDSVRRAIERADTLAGSADYHEALKSLPGGRSLTVFVNLARAVDLARDADAVPGEGFLNWNALGRMRYLAAAQRQEKDRIGGVAFLRIGGE